MRFCLKGWSKAEGEPQARATERSGNLECKAMSRRTETAYKAKFLGKLAQHNKAQRFRGYGKCCGCVSKVHAFIRGDLSGKRLFDVSFYHFGEITGRGNRLTKSRRYQESVPTDSK